MMWSNQESLRRFTVRYVCTVDDICTVDDADVSAHPDGFKSCSRHGHCNPYPAVCVSTCSYGLSLGFNSKDVAPLSGQR